jgi:hypothetical protein
MVAFYGLDVPAGCDATRSTGGRIFSCPAVRQHARRNTRKGKQVLNVTPPDNARANAMVEGELTGPENFEAGTQGLMFGIPQGYDCKIDAADSRNTVHPIASSSSRSGRAQFMHEKAHPNCRATD